MSLPALLTIAALVAGLLSGVATWRVQDWRYAAKENARVLEEIRVRDKNAGAVDSAAAGHEGDKTAINTEFVTITQEVERVIENISYRNICLDDDGLRVLGAAIRGRDAASQPADVLPGLGGARGRDERGNAPLVSGNSEGLPRVSEPPSPGR